MKNARSASSSILAILTIAVSVACTTSAPAPKRPITEPVVDEPGRNITRYRGPRVEVVVGTKHASNTVGSDWLILHVGVGGMVSESIEVRRDKVTLRTPDGEWHSIMPHQEFSSRYSEIAGPARQAAIAAEPLDFTRPGRTDCALGFMPLPGTGIVLEGQQVNLRKFCQGFLYFPMPGGVQAGPYMLKIELDEWNVRVPFTIE
jgi:hypothetical protein